MGKTFQCNCLMKEECNFVRLRYKEVSHSTVTKQAKWSVHFFVPILKKRSVIQLKKRQTLLWYENVLQEACPLHSKDVYLSLLTVFYVMKLLVSLITMTLQLSAQFSTYFKDCIVWADSRMLHNVVVLEGWKTEQRKINLLARFSLKI